MILSPVDTEEGTELLLGIKEAPLARRAAVRTILDEVKKDAPIVERNVLINTGVVGIGVAGGVSANSLLRAEVQSSGAAREIPVFVPSLSLSTDNAAMIAAAGLRRLRGGHVSDLTFNADAALSL